MVNLSCGQESSASGQRIQTAPIGPGRILSVSRGGDVYVSRGYRIYRSTDNGRSWQLRCAMPQSALRRLASCSRLASRLLRHEVKAIGVTTDDTIIASNREFVYYAASGDPDMIPARIEDGGQRLAPPMTITVGPNDRVLWGEYNSRTAHGLPVRLFVSDDQGRSYRIARVFEGGSILHLHNLQFDERLRCYWVLAGDHNHEPGIGRLSEDLRDFDWIAKGEQRFRAVQVFDFGDTLVYGTDTEREKNAVIRFEKATARVERLQELDGSCIYGARFGGVYALSTSIEVSSVNLSREAGLWISRDGENWTRVFSATKDRWHPIYFQFGSIVLPRGETESQIIYFSGQALSGVDGMAFSCSISP
ncbi:MAG: hypothetical protein KF841_10195 [Phycisphaerae bacterium]|nr:hypothetical protein [Phycisphaerae bacterium]